MCKNAKKWLRSKRSSRRSVQVLHCRVHLMRGFQNQFILCADRNFDNSLMLKVGTNSGILESETRTPYRRARSYPRNSLVKILFQQELQSKLFQRCE